MAKCHGRKFQRTKFKISIVLLSVSTDDYKILGRFNSQPAAGFGLAVTNNFYSVTRTSEMCELLTVTLYAAGQIFSPADSFVNLF